MKKLVLLAVLILALSASIVGAVSNSWTVDLAINPGVTTTATKDAVITYGLYAFNWDGTWGITGTGSGANYIKGALDATPNSQVANAVPTPTDWLYKYFYTADGGGTWIEIGALFQGTVYSGSQVLTGSLAASGGGAVYANGMRLVYGANAGILGTDTANGLLSMTAKAVPEASTMIGFGSALVMAGPGMIGWLRRRRS